MNLKPVHLVSAAAALLLLSACDSNDNPAAGVNPTPTPTPTPVPRVGFDLVDDRVITQANDLRGLLYAADGKILVSGHVGSEAALRQTVVGRFNADGSPDTSFGDDGFVTVDVAPGRNEQSLAVTELSGGDIVAAVNAVDADGGQSIYLLRFAPDGSRRTLADGWGDATGAVEVVFGWPNVNNAGFTGTTPPSDTAWDLLVDRSGAGERLVVMGFGAAAPGTDRTDNDRYVTRLDAADGSMDTAFNGGEVFSYHTTGTLNDNSRRGLVESDGAMVSAGYTNLGEGLGNHVFLIRLTAAGELDTSFGGFILPESTAMDAGISEQPGIAIFNPFRVDGGFAEAYGAARQSNGDYVTTGYGLATALEGTSTLGYRTSEAPDVVPFRVSGMMFDTSWANGGTQAVQSEGQGQPTSEDRGRDMVILADGRTVHAGRYGGVPAIFVFTTAGQLDAGVDEDGIIELPNETTSAQFFNIALSPDGSRLAATTNNDAAGARLVILEAQD